MQPLGNAARVVPLLVLVLSKWYSSGRERARCSVIEKTVGAFEGGNQVGLPLGTTTAGESGDNLSTAESVRL